MKTIFDHIEQIKKKPHHVRKRIAYGAATAGTALVAFVWFVGALRTGTFAIQGSSFTESTGQGSVVATGGTRGSQNLAGAGAAATLSSAPAHIEIIDTASSTQGAKRVEQTVIPF